MFVLLPLEVQFTARRVRHSHVSTGRKMNISKVWDGHADVLTCIPVYLA